MKELNSRISEKDIAALNFRPNLVIKGEKLIPYEEDHWDWIKIGDVVFRYLAPCTRYCGDTRKMCTSGIIDMI